MISPLLAVRDVPASMTFYTERLGFTVATILPGADGEPVFATLQYGDAMLSLDNTEHADFPADTRFGQGVDLFIELHKDVEVDDLHEQLKNAGVTIVQAPKDEFWGDRRMVINDPDGYRLSLYKTVRVVTNEEMIESMQQS